MKRAIKKVFVLWMIMLCTVICINVYADMPFECHTAPKLLEEATNALARKKLAELNET